MSLSARNDALAAVRTAYERAREADDARSGGEAPEILNRLLNDLGEALNPVTTSDGEPIEESHTIPPESWYTKQARANAGGA